MFKIIALERNKRRFDTLEQMLAKTKCKNVEPILTDFLSVDPLDSRFRKVSHMFVSLAPYDNVLFQLTGMLDSLLDPSCSGSGIVNRLDYLTEEG